MDNDHLTERIHALETAMATQTEAASGAQVTQAASTAGMGGNQRRHHRGSSGRSGGRHAGTWAVMVAGVGGLVLGTLLGLAMAKQ